MEREEGPGDDEPSPPLLPPDDRIWRHPSEVSAHGPPSPATVTGDLGGARDPKAGMWPLAAAACLLGAAASTAALAVWGGFGSRTTMVAVPAVEQVVAPGSTSPMDAPWETVVAIADQLRPAVVSIQVDRPAGPGTATGVVFRSDGHVLTNQHLVVDASRITVHMADGRQMAARLVGGDPETDVAVVKVDAAGLDGAVLGSAAALRVGQMAVALGAPTKGGRPSVSVGTVSAVGRMVEAHGHPALRDMIQTDLPVPAATSGGPLVDAAGAVIGITTDLAGSNPTDGRVGFATPIDTAHDVAVQLIDTGRVVRSWMGIDGEDLEQEAAAALGLAGAARVKSVKEGSPASRAGIAAGDVVTALDGLPVRSMGGLKALLRGRRPGHVVTVALLRDSGTKTVRVALVERPARP